MIYKISKMKSKLQSSYTLMIILISLISMFIRSANSWGYPEDNCYDCFRDSTMYFCRHDTNGLVWGQCCKEGTSSSYECTEQYDSEYRLKTRCSNQSPKSEEMKYYYCLIDQIDGMKSCDLESSQSSSEIEPKNAN